MSKNDLNSCLREINAISKDKVASINVPIDNAVQEAENLYHWSKMDLAKLSTVGITFKKVENLNVRSGACREAQSLWIKNNHLIKDAQKKWNQDSIAAYDFRDELIHAFRYAYRENENLMGRVNSIAEGTGHDDMIQDLNDLSVFGKENSKELIAINFDMSKLQTAATISSEMADILAVANGTKKITDETKIVRDKAYTYLKELVDEIRAAGKYLFWRDDERSVGYRSDYHRRMNRKKTVKVEN